MLLIRLKLWTNQTNRLGIFDYGKSPKTEWLDGDWNLIGTAVCQEVQQVDSPNEAVSKNGSPFKPQFIETNRHLLHNGKLFRIQSFGPANNATTDLWGISNNK